MNIDFALNLSALLYCRFMSGRKAHCLYEPMFNLYECPKMKGEMRAMPVFF